MPSAEYQREWRERKAKEKEIFGSFAERDATGIRYKSEVLSWSDLYRVFAGVKTEQEESAEEAQGDKKKKPVKKSVKPMGSQILGAERDFEEWLELRDKARKNLFWLGRDVLKRDLLPHVHQVVCDQFIQKDFDGAFPAGYTLNDVHKAIGRQDRFDEFGHPCKEMMLLDPRGFYKSTIDGVDCVSWMINCPDVRILILTGEYKLALSFMKEIKDYFYLPVGADPTDFQLLFPEYILTGVDGTSKEPIDCPARRHPQRFPTLWVNSIDANLSGWHCDVRKGDDVVTDRNCNTEDTRQQLKEKFDGTDNLLDEWGFSDYIGTRYWSDDYYGTRLAPGEEGEREPLKYFCRQCWTVKPEYSEVPLRRLTEEMVILAFPEKATWTSLRRKLNKNERSFRNQQLNEPSDPGEDSGFKISFTEDVLRTHMYQPVAAPKEGDIYVCWDWAPSGNKNSDYSAGVAGRIVKKGNSYGIVVLEVIFDKWKPSELAFQMVAFDKKWHPKQTLIEKSSGAELLQLEIARQALKYSTTLNIYWKQMSLQADAKRNRIKGLETLVNDDRLWFVAGPWIDETFYQFTRYTGERKNKGRKDDIPDACSFLCFFLPSTESNEDLKAMQEAAAKAAEIRNNYQRIFGSASISQPQESAPAKPEDPRNKIFGGNGMHI